MDILEISLLPSVTSLRFGGNLLSVSSQKAQALLLFVALSEETTFRRDYLASIFWEDRDSKMARDNLRQTLSRIKKTCGPLDPAIHIARNHITVNKDNISTDADRLLQNLRTVNGTHSIDLPALDFDGVFSEYHDVGSAFQSWIHVYKNGLERKTSSALLKILQATDSPDENSSAVAAALLNIDPTNEPACRHLMKYYGQRGAHSRAVAYYNALYHLLDEDYALEPSAETIELNAAIKLGHLEPGGAKTDERISVSAPTQDQPPIFIAEFDQDNRHRTVRRMGRFFRADLLGNLSRFREWVVIDAAPEAAEYYQLDSQVEGEGEDLAAILTLRKNPARRILWSERFVIGFHNWGKIQMHIAQQIAQVVNHRLTTDRLTSSLNELPENRRTFDKWVFSSNLNAQWSPTATRQAIDILEEITSEEPNFSPAHATLAAIHNKIHLVYPGLHRSKASTVSALRYAQNAMNLDPLDTNTHRVLAWAKMLNGDHNVAEFHFQRAIELNPADIHVRASCALGFAFLDNLPLACEIADKTIASSAPLKAFHWGYFQNIYFLANRLKDAKAAGNRAGSAIQNLPAWQAAILNELGEPAEADTNRNLFFDLARDNWQGEGPATDTAILTWLKQCFPLKNEAQKLRLVRGLQQENTRSN